MSNFNAWKLFSIFCFSLLLLGCESKEEQVQKSVQLEVTSTELEISSLKKALDNGYIRNAKLLKEYDSYLQTKKPELSQISALVAQDATTQGPLFKGLTTRLNEIKNEPVTLDNAFIQLDRLAKIKEAAKLSLFGDALTDPINVLADMSDGNLGRVGAISQQAENASSKGDNFGAGSQMVGNPNYGNWQTNSSGISFWQWYGMYRMFGDVVGGISYDRWSSKRRYSYYNDYGRSRYTSQKQYKTQQKIETRTKQSFKRQGKQFTSPYAKKRSGASSLSRSSYTPVKSSYSRSSYSKSSGSVRNSSSRTSRGVSRGK
ncbi:hypothetical protein [Pseudoalteromonas denitrificans]|uniref:Uncharacterized protein n=1 Tax=Pseudoalteromonas denitrificans DSM 6059 TaxID=1123010 RepID=A0A1I1EN37_9GAMM|nr:hypothetical protein [Pseudoalteromonas denitrificans]SFB88515.1 hypothetical protein SAMN02745724_00359 [Pseudoalteromonas denitrificans DSM 6059]